MTLNEAGFLSPAIAPWIERHRAKNHDWFALAQNLNALGMRTIPSLTIAPSDNRSFLAALLFMRCLSSFQAALLLAERGLTQDARTLTRSCFECVFWLGALRNDPGFADSLVRDDYSRRAKIARPLLKLPDGSGLDAEHIEKLERFLNDLKNSGIEPAEVRIAYAAKLAGLGEIYDTYYRGLSNDAAHPSVTSLNRYVEADINNTVVGLRWGPDVPDVGSTLSDLCTAFIYLLVWTNELFSLNELQEGLQPHWAEYKRMVDAQSARSGG